jgi:ubiquinone/menaquinone biosynthesis C-methylase UbiE
MAPVDVDQIKQRQAMIWGQGDYSGLSEQLRPAAIELRDLCAVSAGQEVLDVAAGDGNFALACAQEGASVVASDISPGMVERGRARSEAEGYDIEWLEADAEELPFEDERFDCVGSVFGAMIAPRPERVASELIRVARPGGTVGMTAWRPDALVPRIGELSRKYTPGGPPGPLPEEWAVEETARERFDGLAARVDFEIRSLATEAGSPEEYLERLCGSAPPLVAAKMAMEPEAFEAMSAEILGYVRSQSGDGPVRLASEYALIVARKRG